ncbi:MAG: hypothetical protein ACSHX7_06055 [Luteolibacter sp.]
MNEITTTKTPLPLKQESSFCPLSPSCDAMALLDETTRRALKNHSHTGSRFTDCLLELRQSFSQLRIHPETAIQTFYSVKHILTKRDYLTSFRLRTLLTKQIRVVVGEEKSIRPLDLRWKTFDKLTNHYRREYFEMADTSAEFASIPVSFVWFYPDAS